MVEKVKKLLLKTFNQARGHLLGIEKVIVTVVKPNEQEGYLMLHMASVILCPIMYAA